MRRLREQFPEELVVIGVHSAKFPSEQLTTNIRQAIMRHDIRHPVVNDAGFAIWQQYGVSAWPTITLIDPEGKIVGVQPGEIDAEAFIPIIQGIVAASEREGKLDRSPLDLRPEALAEPTRLLKYPSKLLVGPDGRLFVADTGQHRILELSLSPDGESGEVVRVFGSGQPGLQDGPADAAAFHNPHGMALSGTTLYVADTDNHTIRAIDLASGEVRTAAGTGEIARGLPREGLTPTQTPLRSPWALVAADDKLFIAMAGSHQVWMLIREEELSLFAGNGREALVDGPRNRASFNQPSDLALGMGDLLVADSEASAIRSISLDSQGEVVTLVGQGLFEFGDVDGIGAKVRLQHPTGVALADGLVYIADSYNHKIKQLDPTTGRVETLIGTGEPGHADGLFDQAQLFEPEGISVYNGKLYIADTNSHLIRVADLRTGVVRTLALTGLERLRVGAVEDRPAQQLDPVTVAPGEVTLTLDIQLPPGYKLNAAAPLTLREDDTRTLHTFESATSPALTLQVNADRDLTLDMTLYYCQAEDERLCMIHDARLVIPLIVAKDGQSAQTISYRVTLGGL